jgi:rhodanese-related sulfurtransferase
MNNKIQKIALLGACLLATTPEITNAHRAKPLQNSREAVRFFSHELEFKTTPYGVNAVLDGKVKDVIIVDVRSAKDYAEGHIPGAINIPGNEHNYFDGHEREFKGLRKDKYTYVYCYALLCNLGQKAAKKLASLGYPVKEIVGGWDEWKKGGNRIEK